MSRNEMKTLAVILPMELVKKVEREANEERRSVSNFIRVIVEDYLREKKTASEIK